jgi:hypothetical protein
MTAILHRCRRFFSSPWVVHGLRSLASLQRSRGASIAQVYGPPWFTTCKWCCWSTAQQSRHVPAARRTVAKPCGPSLKLYKSRMNALRVGYAWEPQEGVAPIIPKSRKGVAIPSRTLRVFDRLVGGYHEQMRAWQRR